MVKSPFRTYPRGMTITKSSGDCTGEGVPVVYCRFTTNLEREASNTMGDAVAVPTGENTMDVLPVFLTVTDVGCSSNNILKIGSLSESDRVMVGA